MQYYAFSSHLKETNSAANNLEDEKKVEVILDVRDQPVFTMQEVCDGKGGSLLVVYDSGAMTSGVTTSTAARLGSKTVKQGAISYTVLGNEIRVTFSLLMLTVPRLTTPRVSLASNVQLARLKMLQLLVVRISSCPSCPSIERQNYFPLRKR